jgi:hypothetical protein
MEDRSPKTLGRRRRLIEKETRLTSYKARRLGREERYHARNVRGVGLAPVAAILACHVAVQKKQNSSVAYSSTVRDSNSFIRPREEERTGGVQGRKGEGIPFRIDCEEVFRNMFARGANCSAGMRGSYYHISPRRLAWRGGRIALMGVMTAPTFYLFISSKRQHHVQAQVSTWGVCVHRDSMLLEFAG